VITDYTSSSRLLVYGHDYTRNNIHFWSVIDHLHHINTTTTSSPLSSIASHQWVYHGTLMDAPAWAMYLIDDIHHQIIRAGPLYSQHALLHSRARGWLHFRYMIHIVVMV
jgi:hypothetical protein